MKSMIKRIIVGVSIGLIMYFLTGCTVVHAAQQVVYLEPNLSYVSWCNRLGHTNCNASITSTIQSGNFLAATWYYVDVNLGNDNDLSRVSWRYDLTNIDSNYISFTVYSEMQSGVAVLDGRACEKYTGEYFRYFSGSDNGTMVDNGYSIYVCPNSKNEDSWLDIYYNNSYNNSYAPVYRAVILNWVNTFEKYGDITAEINANTQAQNETNDFLKDTSTPSTSDYDFDSFNEENGVITNLLTMPITLIQVMLNGLNGSCTPYRLGNLLGSDLTLPCINLSSHLGIVWTTIDIILSGVFIWFFGRRCIRIFNDVTNMKDNQVNEVFK